MLGMVIHLQIREKHVENPASHRLSLEMPVACVFGVTAPTVLRHPGCPEHCLCCGYPSVPEQLSR